MTKRIFLPFVILFLVLSGCAQLQPVPVNDETNRIKVAFIGIDGSYSDKGFLIQQVLPELPAYAAGIRTGDLAISVNDTKITSKKAFQDWKKTAKPESEWVISLMRDGQPMTLRVKPKFVEMYPTHLKIKELIEEGGKVSVAVFVAEVKNLPGARIKDDWKDSVGRQLLADTEAVLALAFRNNKNFRVVDRSVTGRILEEYKFSQSGLVSEEMRTKLGKMHGATHLIQVDFQRFPRSSRSVSDNVQRKLIDIQTGDILAVDFRRHVNQIK